MPYETLEQLVEQRRGYKYLNSDGTSPYQRYQYVLRKGKVFETELSMDLAEDCGAGWNLATLDWILEDTYILGKKIVEFSIPEDATIVVPINSDGKFRTNKIRYEKIHSVKTLFPEIWKINHKLKTYKPINPIQATEMPPVNKIRKILTQIRDQVGDRVGHQVWNQVWNQVRNQVWHQVWNQVRNQVGNQVWHQVRNQVGNQVGDRVGNQVWDQVWHQVRNQVGHQVRNQVGHQVRNQVWHQVWHQVRNQVGHQVRNQVRNQVWDQVCSQVYIISYFAIKEFMGLEYDHPAFDLVRLGIITVIVDNTVKVFGKNGMFLGEFEL